MTVKERIAALRDKMRANGIDAYIVFDSDEHMSEYLPEYYRERSWISGFTGSAGTVVVTQQEAGLWTDGRYYLQAASQLSGSGVTLFRASDAGVISLTDYLFKSVSSGGTIALDGRVASTAMVLELREKCAVNDITLRTDLRLVDQLWTEDRPALPSGMAFAYPEDYAGLSVRKKLQLVREKMEKLRLDYYVVGALDSLCWLYNLRGSDVDTSPLFTGFAMICQDEAVLFGDRERIPDSLAASLAEAGVQILPAMIFTRRLQHCPDGAGSASRPGRSMLPSMITWVNGWTVCCWRTTLSSISRW